MNTPKQKKTAKKKRASHNHSTSDANTQNSIVHSVTSALFGMTVGAICALVLTAIGAFICYSSKDPDALLTPAAFAVLYLSSMISGFAAVRKNRTSALLCGGLSGTLMMLLFILCSLFFNESASSSFKFPISLLLRVAMIAAAIFGGYIGLGRKSSSHRPRKK